MKKKLHFVYTFFGILFLGFLFLANETPPNGYTGGPPTYLHCQSCHSQNNTFYGTMAVNGFYADLEPNTTYHIIITFTRTASQGLLKCGFELAVLDPNGNSVGALTNPGSFVSLSTAGSVAYAKCNPAQSMPLGAGGQYTYTVDWVSPAGPNGLQATLHVGGLISNAIGTANDHPIQKSLAGLLSIPDPLSVQFVNVQLVTCPGGNDGQGTAQGLGGIPPYSYVWSTGYVGATLSGVPAGDYTVTVTDAGAATTTGVMTIKEPLPFNTSTNVTNVLCSGESTGGIDLNVSGGNSGYTYLWSNNSTNQDITQAPAGNYFVTITDQEGCTAFESASISQPPPLSIGSPNVLPETCGASNGSISFNISGGTPNYSCQWSDGANTCNRNNLSSGTYSLTITDANQCTATTSVTVPSVPGFTITATPANPDCADPGSGAISLSISGGTAPFTCNWSDSSSDCDRTELFAGTYSVTVTDVNDCSESATISLTQPSAPNLSTSTEDVSCPGGMDGLIILIPVGGAMPYQFEWSNGETTKDLTNIGAGTYSVTVTDANGCTKTKQGITVEEPPSFILLENVTEETGNNMNGAISIIVSGGNGGPYDYEWIFNGSFFSNEMNLNGLSSGAYIVEITDQDGCFFTDTILVGGVVAVLQSSLGETVRLFPNPASGIVFLNFDIPQLLVAEITFYDLMGQIMLTLSKEKLIGRAIELDLADLAAGMYIVNIKLGDEIMVKRVIVWK